MSSGFLFNRNEIYKKNKILSDIYTPKDNTLNKNIFNIGNINIKNKDKNNEFLNNLKEYFSYNNINNINNNIESSKAYQPFDLNCIFNMPRKKIKEKMIYILKNMKFKVKHINAYKYSIIHEGKNEIYEFSLPWNHLGIIKFKKVRGFNNEFINNTRKIIYRINK